MNRRGMAAWSLVLLSLTVPARADDPPPPLAEYFRAETAKLAARPLAGADSADAWKAARPELQRQLREMLGLDPMPPRGDLRVKVTGTVERPDFVVEKLLYQSSPGLYVTANLYRPVKSEGRLPAIVYVCGHSKVERDGLIYGCKAHYQFHAAWFAANGYVCLVLDTIQLGEVPGLHHGMYYEGMWWWQSRGHTPAGVEAWNAVRAIDYLTSRPDVDPARIGVTGRSGGGATSWWVAAIDDRVAAAAPVAGITDMTDHVVDGMVEGHCDCMYFVNTYRWDFPTVAALVAPRPMLIVNTDSDPIFPEVGVRRVHAHAQNAYDWYGARDRLGLVIGKGGHVDTPEIRDPAFAFFEKHLKGKLVDPSKIEEPDRSIPIEQLKVLEKGEVPPYARNGSIHETFVDAAPVPKVPKSAQEWPVLREKWLAEAKSKVFSGWPRKEEAVPPDLKAVMDLPLQGVGCYIYEFASQEGIRMRLWSVVGEKAQVFHQPVTLYVLDQAAWDGGVGDLIKWFDQVHEWAKEAAKESEKENGNVKPMPLQPTRLAKTWMGVFNEAPGPYVFVAPRGVGPTAWPETKDVHVRRRFELLGQTLDGMRAWDVARAASLIGELPNLQGLPLRVVAQGQAATPALWAAVFEPKIGEVKLFDPPATWRDAPAFLNVERVLGVPQAASLLYPRPLTLVGIAREPWEWASALGRALSPSRAWPAFEDRPDR